MTPPLEHQPPRVGGDRHLRGSSKKKIFVTLQMPTDTVTNVFSSKGREYGDFLRFVETLAANHQETCDFYFKPHLDHLSFR